MPSRNVLAILVIVTTFNLGESFFFMKPVPMSGGGSVKHSHPLVAKKTKSTVTKTSFSVMTTGGLNSDAEAGFMSAKGTGGMGGMFNNFAANFMNFKGAHNSCGCGGDNCVKFAKCKIPGWNPVCCDNKCKCVQKTAKAVSAHYKKTCTMCAFTFSIMLCRDATMTEFNCWTDYNKKGGKDAAAAPAAPEATFQYAYFR